MSLARAPNACKVLNRTIRPTTSDVGAALSNSNPRPQSTWRCLPHDTRHRHSSSSAHDQRLARGRPNFVASPSLSVERLPFFHQNKHKRRHSACQSRLFASAPAPQPLVHTSDGDDGTGIDFAKPSDHLNMDKPPERPRLEALRQILNDKKDGGLGDEMQLSAAAANPNLRSVQINKTNGKAKINKKKAGQKEKTGQSHASIEEIVAMIHELPDIDYAEEDKTTALTDTFGRQHSYLRISLSERCNLRCLYCMPADGVPLQPESHLLSDDEIVRLAGWFVDHGVTKIRLTGGEPLLRKGLPDLIRRLRDLSPDIEQIGMTTNGLTLSRQLPDLVDAGLTHVNVSLDSLDADKFSRLTRRPASYHARVMQAISDCSEQLSPQRVKVNCVVLPDNLDELGDFCELTVGAYRNPIDVRFIEFMPFSDNLWQSGGFVSYQDMQDRIANAGIDLRRLEDGPNDTTKWWSLRDGTDAGRIGFITSMSQHFCGTCNRLRLTSDGQLKVCLFGATEVSLRDLLRHEVYGRDEALLRKVIAYSVRRKHFSLGGHKDMMALQAHSAENRPMTLIGG